MILIIKHKPREWGKCRYKFAKYDFISSYHSSVVNAISEFLRCKVGKYTFVYQGIEYEGIRFSGDMRTEVRCVKQNG